MTDVTIFGKGNMGTAIADVLTAGGATVDHIQSSDPPGPVNGDIVVLAVPHPALKDILDDYADKLAGKIVVDVTNPVDFETFDSLVVPAHSSAAADLPMSCLPPGCSRRSTRTLRPHSARKHRPKHDTCSRRRRRCRRKGDIHFGRSGWWAGCHRRRRTKPGP